MERQNDKKGFGKALRSLIPKIIDFYIIRKFLGLSFFVSSSF